MHSTQAWELLCDPERCGQLRMDGFYKLLIRAGYSAEVARKAALQRGWDRLSAGEVM